MPNETPDGSSYIAGLLRKVPTPPPDPFVQAILDLASAVRGLTYEMKEQRLGEVKTKRWTNKGS
jgi:hypothetical protein